MACRTPLFVPSMPPVPVVGGQALPDDPARVPYWTIPELGGRTIAFQTPPAGVLDVRDCAGQKSDLVRGGQAGLARLADGTPKLRARSARERGRG